MNRKYAAWITHVAHHRIFASFLKLAVSRKAQYAVAYASPFAPFLLRTLRLRRINRRFRRTSRGPGRDSTVPWFDRQLQVESQGFGWWIAKLYASLTSGETPLLHFARWRMMLGSSAAVKDQPASPQPSPHPNGERKIDMRGNHPSNS